MITLHGLGYQSPRIHVKWPAIMGNDDELELIVEHHPDEESGRSISLNLRKLEAHALCDYLHRALGEG